MRMGGARSRVWCLALALASAPVAHAGETLQDAWTVALQANSGFQAARIGVAAAQSDLSAARRERIPTIHTMNAQTFLSQSPAFKINAPQLGAISPGLSSFSFPFLNQNFFFSSTLMNIPLYTGGRIQSGVDRSAAAVGVAHATTETSALDLKIEVAKAYLNVLRLEKLVMLNETSVKNLEAHVRDVQSLFDEGAASRNDLLSVQVSLARSRQKALQTQNELETARAQYNQLLSRPLDAPVQLEEIRLSQVQPEHAAEAAARIDVESPAEKQTRAAEKKTESDAEIARLTELAIRNRPELAGLSAQAAELAASARQVEAGHKPQVGVLGGYIYFQDSHLTDPNFFTGSIVAQWTLFDGRKSKTRADGLRMREAQTLRLRQDAASLIALSIRRAWETTQSDRARLTVSQAAIDRARENLRVARERYVQQVGTNTEVLDAETLRVQTYTDYYDVFYDLVLDGFTLQRAVGLL